jgi:hypothetical protein
MWQHDEMTMRNLTIPSIFYDFIRQTFNWSVSSCEFISLEEHYEVTVSLKMKAINLKKGKLLNGKLIEEKIFSVGKRPCWNINRSVDTSRLVHNGWFLSAVTAIWPLMAVAEHRDTFWGANTLFPQNWICDVISNTCWYLDNLTALIKPPSSGKLTRIVTQCRQGRFVAHNFKLIIQ